MTTISPPDQRLNALSGTSAAILGLTEAGCRLLFAGPSAYVQIPADLALAEAWLSRAGGRLVAVQSDTDAALMAAGAAMGGVRAAALLAGDGPAPASLTGLDDLTPVLLDVTQRLPLQGAALLAVLAPHTAQAAYGAGQSAFAQAEALRSPLLIAGLEIEPGEVHPHPPEQGLLPPIHHDGPDDPDLLICGAGPGFAACAEAREDLEARGYGAAHLHLLQIAPFPGAILAPALTSARRVLIVEPGGPGSLAGLIRSHLGAPVTPFSELPRQAGAVINAASIADRAQDLRRDGGER